MDLRTPHDHLDDHANRFPNRLVFAAYDLLDDWDGWKYGPAPSTGAAVALYTAARLDAPDAGPGGVYAQDEVAAVFGCSGEAIRAHWHDCLAAAAADDETAERLQADAAKRSEAAAAGNAAYQAKRERIKARLGRYPNH